MKRLVLFSALTGMALTLAACGGSNRLRYYDFTSETAAVIAAVPPRPIVFTSAGDAWIDLRRPVQSIVRAGTAAVKEAERERAQKRLDTAFQYVDISELMAASLLSLSADYLGYEPVGDPRRADVLLDVRIFEYGVMADSWENATYFIVRGDLVLIDNQTKEIIWKKRFKEREPITDSIFGLGTSVGNVMTARMLSSLDIDDLVHGLERLADHSAQHMAYVLHRDSQKARRRR